MFKTYKSITIRIAIVTSLCLNAAFSIMADEYNDYLPERPNHRRQHTFTENIANRIEDA